MSLPDFTDDERYLINFVKSPKAGGSSYMLGYVVGAVIIAGFAAHYGSIPMMLAAFVVVCGFRVYEECYQVKWMPLWRSIVDKYEAACVSESAGRTGDSHADQ